MSSRTTRNARNISMASRQLTRPPSELSSSDEDDNADIQPQIFERNAMKRHNSNRQADKVSLSKTNGRSYCGVNSYRSMRGLDKTVSGSSTQSQDSRSNDITSLPKLNNRFSDNFEKRNPRKKIQPVYRSSSQTIQTSQSSQPKSSQSSQSSQSSLPGSSQTHQSSPQKRLKSVKIYSDNSSDSDQSPRKKIKTINFGFSDSDCSDDMVPKSFKAPEIELFRPMCHDIPQQIFVNQDQLLCSSRASSPTSKNISDAGFSKISHAENNLSSPTSKTKLSKNNSPVSIGGSADISHTGSPYTSEKVISDISATNSQPQKVFHGFDLDEELIFVKKRMTRSTWNQIKLAEVNAAENYTKSSLTAVCPMCNGPVSPRDLRKHGTMNTRKQEKFCLSHRKKSAQQEWERNRYPDIDWDKLDSRISKHHEFLRNLINGEDSHYREALREKVNEGKDRNLRTMTSNLIPGYYGPRGLRLISENVFREFTPLLKKRIVQDRLMAARGYTPYVQSVLVPEVASLLIQEDLNVDLHEARKIIRQSAAIGELLHEEIKDVIPKKKRH